MTHTDLKLFFVHFDFFERESDVFVKRTSIPYYAKDEQACTESAVKYSLILLKLGKPEWTVRIGVDEFPVPVVSECLSNDT